MVVRELVTLLGFELKDAPLKQYDKQIDSTKQKSNGLATAARGVSTAWKIAAAAVAVGVGWISKNIIEATVEMEKYRTQIQAFTGNATDAAAALEDLRDKTSDALFGTGTLVNAYKQLRTVGMGAQDTSRMIDVLGDVANGSAENFSALSGILTNVATTGKVNERTLKQLTNAGFGLNDMAQGLGISVGQLNKDIAAGKIGFNDLTKAMAGATKEGGRFYMNAANQAMTLGGSLKIIKSLISGIGEAIGKTVAPALANLISYVTDLIKLGKTGLVDFGAKAFNYLIHVIAQVIIFFEVLNMRMNKYGGSFTALKGIFQDVFGFFKSVIQSAWPFLMNLAQLILVAFKPLRAFVQPVLEALKPIIQKVFGFLSRMIERLIPIVDGLTPLFGKLGQFVGKLIGPILGVAAAIKGVNTAIAIGKGAVAIGKGAIAGVKALQTAYGLLTGTMSVMRAAAEGNRLALFMLDAQMKINKITTLAHAAATKVASAATAAWDWIKMTAGIIKNTAVLVANKIAIIAVSVAQKIATLATQIWTAIQWLLNAAMTANPIGIIIMAIAALIAIIILLVKNWDKVKEVAGKVWDWITEKISAAVDFIKNIFGKIGEFFSGVWDGVKNVAGKAWDGIKNTASKAWEGIKSGATKAGGFLKNNWKSIALGMVNPWAGGLKYMYDHNEKFRNAVDKTWGKIKDIAGKVWDKMPDGVKNVFIKIKNIITAVIDEIKVIINGIKEFFVGLWGALKQGPAATFTYLKTSFKKLVTYIIDLWKRLLAPVKKVFQGIAQAASTAWNGIVNGVRSVVDRIKEIWQTITGFFSSLWEGIKNIAENVWNGIKTAAFSVVDGIKNLWQGFLSFFRGLWEAMKAGPSETIDYIKNAFLNLFENIKEKFFGFINIIKDGWDKVKGFFSGIGQGVTDLVTGGNGRNNNAGAGRNNPSGTITTSAMESAAARNVYNNNGGNSSQTINASSNINVTVPPGTTQEQARAISQQVDRAVQDSLASAIGGARGTIPSPEVRRK